MFDSSVYDQVLFGGEGLEEAPVTGTTTLMANLNRLAGTEGLAEQGAANAWAGTDGLGLLGALNAHNGSVGLDLQGVLNELAGTEGLAVVAAAEAIVA